MSGLSLAQQLKQLQAGNTSVPDPESAYSNLDTNKTEREGDEGREHYLDVGPSRLRMELGGEGGGTLTGPKYEGVKAGRQKIFDDDDEESEPEGDEASEGEDDEEDDLDEGSEDEENEEDGEEEEEEEGEDEDEDEGGEEQEEEPRPKAKSSKLDPMAVLKESRSKDVQKGQAIRKQKALFESLITLRITFQKALSASQSVPVPLPADPEGELSNKKTAILQSLGDLNERLFRLRTGINLVASEDEEAEEAKLGKRKRTTGDEQDEEYWLESARESLALVDDSHLNLIPVLNKWSGKIQAASLQLGSKQAGGSKFLQQMKTGAGGIIDAIETGISNKRDSEKTLVENEETGYRALLREVIESRSGSGPAADLTHLRREKKKKREAERGGSKGRKLRYTVHDKVQNFVVPIPLSHGWHEEQVDELFSSLFGGVGMKGAVAETTVGPDIGAADEGLVELGGLRVF
ncbi:protein BFR2 [Cryptococcus sp. DSM 104548]